MLIIGLTGGIGSGKTAATDRFHAHGITIVDADIVARQVVEPGTPALTQIREHFGANVITAEGALDRRALREIVFANPAERKWLEALTHPLIGQEIRRQLEASQTPYTLLVSPLLFESGQVLMAHRTVLVDAPIEAQIHRTIARDNTTEAGARAIVDAQMPREQRLARADDVLTNDQDLAHLHAQVDALHQRYLAMAANRQQGAADLSKGSANP
ncbi:Dephospho-CoA kinase [gamma proteobacterium HdN1]|nr:Dephospho-CoA kinase [gamma proteobacterium HdN1]